jgi:PhzF family phenazine biosynthesis protein
MRGVKLTMYQIDAFADRTFAGNQACVCPLTAWLDDHTLQSIAAENNVAETAFFVPKGEGYHLRWCTPTIEVDLCGHATLAAAYVIFTHLRPELQRVSFDTRSGIVTVDREADRLVLDFPSRPGVPENVTDEIVAALGLAPREVLRSRDLMCVFETAEQVRRLKPDMDRVAQLKCLGVIATAPGDEPDVDFVSRFFAPQSGIPEDPATGSAHCTLTPYWSARLGRTQLHARQLSSRGAELWLTQCGERVRIAGRAVQYLQGTIDV